MSTPLVKVEDLPPELAALLPADREGEDDWPLAFVAAGWDRLLDVGHGVVALHYPPDHAHAGWAIAHQCLTGAANSPSRLPVLVAPRCSKHDLISDDPLTLSPSIACVSCGLHGFITDSVWRPA